MTRARRPARNDHRLAIVSTAPAVEIASLVKQYRRARAVDGLTLTAARSKVTSILGPNGAGKTTTIEICEGYRAPTVAGSGCSAWTRPRQPRAAAPGRGHAPVGRGAAGHPGR